MHVYLNKCGATKQKQRLGCFWKFGFFPIFSLYTYWTMYSVNFKSFRLKMTSESLISRYVVQNTTFEISPFKVSSHIPWYNKCTMKILKEGVEKMPPMLQFFLRWQIKGQWWRKKRKKYIKYFVSVTKIFYVWNSNLACMFLEFQINRFVLSVQGNLFWKLFATLIGCIFVEFKMDCFYIGL